MESKYAEIRCNFFDEKENVWCIDAWLTPDNNEEGTVIATIDLKNNVKYLDEDAKTDAYAQAVIKDVIKNNTKQ